MAGHHSTLPRRGGHVGVIRILLEQGADPAARNSDGRTPFHLASWGGHVEVIRILLELGADPAAWNSDGQIPSHLASESGHEEVIQVLSQYPSYECIG
jgi:ankyrin repeat protein